MPIAMGRLDHRFLLRIPEDLWRDIQAQAAKNGRSVNSEIVWRLRKAIQGYSR